MIRLGRDVWRHTLEHFHECGSGHVECVVYWVARQDDVDHVVGVVHPRHAATAWSYDVEEAWLTEFMIQLHRGRQTVRAQVHTHAGAAFHSQTDDRWALVQVPGFLSLVLPRFALAPIDIAEVFLAELGSDGGWHEVSPSAHVLGLR